MVLDSRTLAWATLAHKALPQRALVTLLREFGDPESLLHASHAQLARLVPAAIVERALTSVADDVLQRTSRWLDQPDHHLIAWDDADYPQALLELGYAPPTLFHLGRRELLARPALAIVGSRHATAQPRDGA